MPIAIIVGFSLIAAAIYFTNQDKPVAKNENTTTQTNDAKMKPVDGNDYILGNPNAPILMVEYSDYDCPFCKEFHITMHQIIDEYGVTGQVAWVYRQFPIAQLHPNSPKISKAALCVGDVGGNKAFWKFTDKIFDERDFGSPTNVVKLPEYAEYAGVTKDKYIECLESDRMDKTLMDSIQDGLNQGIKGTPHTVLVVGNQTAVIDGAQPYDVVKGIVKNLIDQLEGKVDTASSASSTPTDNKQ